MESEMATAEYSDALARVIESDGDRRWFDFGLDPEVAERIAQLAADRLRAAEPTVVLGFENEEDAVFAHLVARALGATRVTLRSQEGLLWLSHAVQTGSRVAVVSCASASSMSAEVVAGVLETHDSTIVGTFYLHPSDATDLEPMHDQ
jgi:adenine/guanine phosphoribosyltransferase-like PRPP-binding protein